MSKTGKEQILEAARRVIAKNGINNASVQAIADEAGMSKGGLYYHYKSKEHILFDLADGFLRETVAPVKQSIVDKRDKEQLIEIILKGIFRRLGNMDHNKLQFYLTHESILEKGELHDLVSKRFKGWVDIAETAINHIYEDKPSHLSRAMAATVIAMIDGQVTQILLDSELVETEELVELWQVFFEVGIPSMLNHIQQKHP